MITLLISALSGAIGVIVDKVALSRRHLSVHIMAPLQFLFLFLLTAIIVPWIGRFDLAAALSPLALFLFIVMVLLAGAWNVLYYRAVKNETIQEVELIILLGPLVTTLLSAIVLPNERNSQVLIAAVIASLTLIVTHIERRHISLDYYSKWLLVGIFLMAAESIVIKQLLDIWSPAALYMARTFYVFLFFQFLVRPHFDHLAPKSVGWVFTSALFGVIYMVTKFYGYQSVGIVYTTLILALQPALVLFLDRVFLNERLKPKYLVATLVIIVAVIYGTLAR